MLQNSRVTAFTVLELLKENQLLRGGGVGVKLPPSLTRLGFNLFHNCYQLCMESMKDLDCNTKSDMIGVADWGGGHDIS